MLFCLAAAARDVLDCEERLLLLGALLLRRHGYQRLLVELDAVAALVGLQLDEWVGECRVGLDK